LNEYQQRKAGSRLDDVVDHIERLEYSLDEPLTTLPPSTSASAEELNEFIDVFNEAGKRGLRLNKAKLFELRDELSQAECTRAVRSRIVIVLVGLAALLQLLALFLPHA
jgi:hypothetical protein